VVSTCDVAVQYLIERFIQEPQYLRYTPSIVAASAVALALYTLGLPHWVRLVTFERVK